MFIYSELRFYLWTSLQHLTNPCRNKRFLPNLRSMIIYRWIICLLLSNREGFLALAFKVLFQFILNISFQSYYFLLFIIYAFLKAPSVASLVFCMQPALLNSCWAEDDISSFFTWFPQSLRFSSTFKKAFFFSLQLIWSRQEIHSFSNFPSALCNTNTPSFPSCKGFNSIKFRDPFSEVVPF